MVKKSKTDADSSALLNLLRAIATRDFRKASKLLAAEPGLARAAISQGATRQTARAYYFEKIAHYISAGDTALHIAAAAYALPLAHALLTTGANVRAQNRHGAQPLHYAVDGSPNFETWNPRAQTAVIACLLAAGANPNARDKRGVTPLHRAVRNRCAAAVKVLLEHGAGPKLKNGSGSTPTNLARMTTGRGGSGSKAAKMDQRKIIQLLAKHGARSK